MKKVLMTFCMTFMLSTGAALAQVANYDVVPMPKSVIMPTAPGFVLGEQTAVVYPEADADMERNAHFLSDYVSEMTKLKLACQPMNKKAKVSKVARGNILLTLDPKILNDEGYEISVTAKGVTIAGKTPAGVFLGIQTLRKSLPIIAEKPQAVSLPSVYIKDEPRFAYRGMHLDCARHFFSVEFVKEYIDLIALHGMNRFHWHITEDQGWRIEIKKYPRLTEVGAWRSGTVLGRNSGIDDGQRHGGFYTQEQCREIVKYAADRYITIIPEIDMPGHMLAALAAYPELGCTGGPYEVSHTWGVFADVLCPGKEKTFQFVEDVLDEVIQIFPSEYIHIGGDECPRSRWAECPLCQKRIQEEGIKAEGKQSKEDRLQGYFTKRVEKYLNGKGKHLIGWDELLSCNVEASSTIMSWRGAEPGARAAKLGHDVIMSPNKPMYFDHYQTDKQWNEPLSIGGNETVKDVYSFEPIAEDLTADDARHILGVQANVWTEYIAAPRHVEYQILPRMAALAEVQWLQPESKNYDAFLARLGRLKAIYDLHDWTVAPHVFKASE
ncbi:MAG: beta-N-acetylhexosaminidase [Prevotella sp.]|nr:beta-N-acetylhexosaminidase [Prevotella sp.]